MELEIFEVRNVVVHKTDELLRGILWSRKNSTNPSWHFPQHIVRAAELGKDVALYWACWRKTNMMIAVFERPKEWSAVSFYWKPSLFIILVCNEALFYHQWYRKTVCTGWGRNHALRWEHLQYRISQSCRNRNSWVSKDRVLNKAQCITLCIFS